MNQISPVHNISIFVTIVDCRQLSNCCYRAQAIRFCIVEPLFRYCCSVWGCAGSTELNKLQKLQNVAARIITNSSFDTPSRPLIDQLGWKTIEQLIASEFKTMVFKSLYELAPQYLCDLFTRNSKCSSYVLRNSETHLRLPMKKSSNGQRFFSYRGAKA